MYSKVEFRTQPLVDIYNFTPVLSIVNQSITDNSVEVRSNQKSKANDKKSRNKMKTKKQNQNLFIVNQSITSNSLEVRSRPRPTRYTTPTSHFLKNFLKMANNLKINVQTIPIISYYHLCLLQNGTTFPQGATKPLSELCHPLQ